MTSCVLSSGFEPYIYFMDSCTLLPPRCFSNHEYVTITREFFNLLSTYKYDGEGEVAWPEHLDDFHALMERLEAPTKTSLYTSRKHTS